jgi:MFS family permease
MVPNSNGSLGKGFNLFFAAETISAVGDQISYVALPIVATVLLSAGPQVLGAIVAFERIPFFAFGLFVGYFVDAIGPKTFLLISDLMRGLLLVAFSVVLITMGSELPVQWLYVTAFILGTFGVAYSVANATFIVDIVGKDQLLRANGRLAMVTSASETAGPALGAAIIQLLGAPFALLIDGLTFLISYFLIVRIPVRPSVKETENVSDDPGRVIAGIRSGLRYVRGHRMLRQLLLLACGWNFLIQISLVNFIVFATRDLSMSIAGYGLVLTMSGIGFFVGASINERVAARLGAFAHIHLAMAGFYITCGVTSLITDDGFQIVYLSGVFFLGGMLAALYLIRSSTLRQSTASSELLGRVTSVFQSLSLGIVVLGAVFGGFLGETLGSRSSLAILSILGITLVLISTFLVLGSAKFAEQVE